jgi:PAS domain S-box-containing protein
MKTDEKAALSPNESETMSPAAFRLTIHELRVHQIRLAMQNDELRRANATLQAVMDQSPAGIAIADAPSGKLRYVNDMGLMIRGGTREKVINGIGIDQYVASWRLMDLDGRPLKPDEVPLARAILFGETCSREFIIRKDDGDDRIVIGNATPIKDEGGRVVAGVVVFTDMTERKQAEKAMIASEERFRRAVVDSPFPLLLHADDGAILQVSNSWCEITGYTCEELATIGDWTERAYGERKALIQVDIDAIYHMDHRSYQGDYTIRTKSGAMRVWEFSSAPLGLLPDGRRLVISMAMDVTERRQSEALVASHLEELRRWQNVMLDREDRVRELKREVNDFCRRVGEAARYPSQEDVAAEPGETQMKQEHKR